MNLSAATEDCWSSILRACGDDPATICRSPRLFTSIVHINVISFPFRGRMDTHVRRLKILQICGRESLTLHVLHTAVGKS